MKIPFSNLLLVVIGCALLARIASCALPAHAALVKQATLLKPQVVVAPVRGVNLTWLNPPIYEGIFASTNLATPLTN